MSIRSALRELLRKDTSRPLSIRDPEHWRNRLGEEVSGEPVNAVSVMGLSAVWACVNLLAGTIASLPLMIYRTGPDGARKVAYDHPLYRVLHDSPNSLQTAVDFWEFMAGSLELWGNAYARKVVAGDRVVGLVPVMPENPSVRQIGPGRLEYRWTELDKQFVETSDTMLHIRGFGGNPLGGMSTLTFGRRVFGLATAIDKAAGSTFRNGLRPSVSVNFKDFLRGNQREEIEEALARKYAGAMNAGRPFITEGGSGIQVLSINPEEAQMLQSRSFSVEEICRFFGTPPFMIGHTEKSTSWGTGLEQQTLGFQKFTLRRRLKRIEQALMKQVLSPADLVAGIVIEFSLEGLLRGDSAARSTFYQSGLANGWMTINEVRALENLPPVPGGDVPRMQSQNMPITATPAQPALPAPQE